MLKELLLAILLGSIIGFAVTGGIWNFKNKQQSNANPTPMAGGPSILKEEEKENNNTPTPTPENIHFLNIDNPENESVTNKGETTLSGNTTTNSIIAIKSITDSFFITTDKDGSFSQDIELEGGINLIQISSIDTNDNQINKEILITYSTAKF
ncbi:hypothetical protein KKE45_03720 [Patescibacteria group bacterium]|nr:hypothetical protein [Patescibacteria group bacterium]